jgi:hypothetical protein
LWGLDVEARRAPDIATELAEKMADPTHAGYTWEKLSEEQRMALSVLLNAGGSMAVAVFERSFGKIRPMGPGRMEREMPWRNPISPVEGLWYRGLIFEEFDEARDEAFPVFYVPDALQEALPASAIRETGELALDFVSAPERERLAWGMFLDDVTTVLAFIHNQMVHPLPAGLTVWPDQVRQALLSQLRDDEWERIEFILCLLDQLGWMRLDESGRLRLVAKPVMDWLQSEVAQSLEILVRAWQQMTAWNELQRLPSLQVDDTGGWRNDPVLPRETLLHYISVLPNDRWVSISDFVQTVKSIDPDFQRPGGDYDTWYIRDSASGAYLTGFESWDQVEGVLLRALLSGPAWWLGLVALDDEEEGAQPRLFRILSERDTVPPSSKVRVRPDLTVAIPAACRFERFQLARVANPRMVRDPYVYQLSSVSLRRAQEQGITVEKILQFLEDLSSRPVPKTVRMSLVRWGKQGTEVWLERVVLLRVSEPEILKEIQDTRRTGRYIQSVISPTVAVVAEEDWSGLVTGLAELGLLPECLSDL